MHRCQTVQLENLISSPAERTHPILVNIAHVSIKERLRFVQVAEWHLLLHEHAAVVEAFIDQLDPVVSCVLSLRSEEILGA